MEQLLITFALICGIYDHGTLSYERALINKEKCVLKFINCFQEQGPIKNNIERARVCIEKDIKTNKGE